MKHRDADLQLKMYIHQYTMAAKDVQLYSEKQDMCSNEYGKMDLTLFQQNM